MRMEGIWEKERGGGVLEFGFHLELWVNLS